MAYSSFEELIDDASNDPKLAKLRVAKAKEAGTPVVSKDNNGYRNKAITQRMKGEASEDSNKAKTKMKYTSSVLKKKMTSLSKPDTDDKSKEMIAKRKKVGY